MVKQQSLKESSFVKSKRAQIKSETHEIKLAYMSSRLVSLTPQLNSFLPPFCFSDTTFALNSRRNETKPCQPALNENFNLPYGSHVKKHDTRLLIGCIAFLTCGKRDARHLIGLHWFANKNLLCGSSVCESQYVYNKIHSCCSEWTMYHTMFSKVICTYHKCFSVKLLVFVKRPSLMAYIRLMDHKF